MNDKECIPFAPSLIESMRSLGYSFPAAIADLLDNSISAKAKKIEIISNPASNPTMVIIDDGIGMSDSKLYEAMRYGSGNPLNERDKDDLGRFGLGMKSASLSQCRKLVVVSRQQEKSSGYSWDLDYIIEKKNWRLLQYQEKEIKALPEIERLNKLKHGTYILLADFDRIKDSTSNIAETFNKYLIDMHDHLSLVFHRFISDGLVINLNGIKIVGRDPYLTDNKSTQKLRESSFYIDDQKIVLQPYILPYISKLKQEDLDKVGGKEHLRNDQGFYVYRNKRLIIWGTWFRLERKDELNKLARVMVDIPNSLDYMWSIDVKKSSATLPDKIRRNMYNAVYESVLSSEKVHTYRGRKEKGAEEIDYVWERVKVREGFEYQINRDIPQIKMLSQTMDNQQIKMLSEIINIIEESFPVSSMYVDAAQGKIEERIEESSDKTEQIWQVLQENMKYVKEHSLPVIEYYQMFLKTEPFCNYNEIKRRIQLEIEKNE